MAFTALAFYLVGAVSGMMHYKKAIKPSLSDQMHDHSWHHENKGALMYRLIGDLDGCAIYEGTVRGQKYIFSKGCSLTPKVPHE